MTFTHLTDFSDRLSPMLVKELRQGLRAKTFIGVFLSLQTFLAVMMFSATASSGSDRVGSMVSGIIFSFFAVAVLLVQPLRGINALASEAKSNTLDMMSLTRLSAWKIVSGKWVALVSQTALLLSTIVPYLILRYFFGGMNLIGELMMLAMLFLTSIALTAITVGLSGCSSVVVRSLIPIFGLPTLLMMLLAGVQLGGGGSTNFYDFLAMETREARIGVATYIACLMYLTCTMLSLGASLIAPAAENHSVWRRVFAFVALALLIPAIAANLVKENMHSLIVFIIVVPAILTALTDSAPLVATVRDRFSRFGVPGRSVGHFLYPTWPSGILYSLVLGGLAVIAIFIHPTFHDRRDGVLLLAMLGSLYFPAVWQWIFFRGEGQRLANYMLILAGSGVMVFILSLLTGSMRQGDFLWFFAWHPATFMVMTNASGITTEACWNGVIAVNSILALVLLVVAVTRRGAEIAPGAAEVEPIPET